MRELGKLLVLLVVPLLIVLAVRDPHAVVRLAEIVFTVGGRMLNDTAALLDRLLTGD